MDSYGLVGAGNICPTLHTDERSILYKAQAHAIPVPRTISSAIGRVDGLNERLSKIVDHLGTISDQIGGPRAANAANKAQPVPSTSAVGRLNDSADYAHSYLTEIEGLLASIGRALG